MELKKNKKTDEVKRISKSEKALLDKIHLDIC